MSDYAPMNSPGGNGAPPPPGGPPGGAPDVTNPTAKARSLTTPLDMAAMSRDVGDPATTTVADAFKKALGVDVNTVSIAEFSQMMAERADPSPLKKAKRMGEGAPEPGAGPPGPAAGGEQGPVDMEGLLGRLG